jgi:precorrin-3B synthase
MASMLAQNLSTRIPYPSAQGEGEHVQRRGACPGLSAPMPTGDGLLVRLLPIGTMPLDAFSALCAAAQEHGNGVIEVTARGSIQVRGLNTASARRFADGVAALKIVATDGVPVLSGALAGLDPEEMLDASALAADVRHALAGTSLSARLAPKVSIVIDGGGALNLDGIAADVRLRAESSNGDISVRIGIGGDGASATPLGFIAPADGVEAAMRLLDVIERRGLARARDGLAAEGAAIFRCAIADLLMPDEAPPDARKSGEPIGLHRLRDESLACGIALAFGHADAPSLQQLTEAARAAGAKGIRAAADRALMIIGLTHATAAAFAAAAERLGFIVRADDPRRNVVACAGAPICASAHVAARGIAPLVAEAVAAHLGTAFKVHISGCAKGCAHGGAAALTAVGAPAGCALIANGSVRDTPFMMTAANELPVAIARYVREAKREDGHG